MTPGAQISVARVDRVLVALQLQERPHAVAVDLGVFGIDPKGRVAGVECLLKLLVQKKHATSLGEVFRQLAAVGYAEPYGFFEISQGERAHGRASREGAPGSSELGSGRAGPGSA